MVGARAKPPTPWVPGVSPVHRVEISADQQSTWPDVKPSLDFDLRLDEKNIDSVFYIFDSL
jgi:hypothetical protein